MLALALALAAQVTAADSVPLRGRVLSPDGRPAADAIVCARRAPEQACASQATSDGQGTFVLWLHRGVYLVDAHSDRGRSGAVRVAVAGRPLAGLVLRLRPVALDAIEVRDRVQETRDGRTTRTASELASVPPAMGVEDPLRALGGEVFSQLVNPYAARLAVRGLDPAAARITWDGTRLIGATHVGGLFSALPAGAVGSAEVDLIGADIADEDGLVATVMFRSPDTPRVEIRGNILALEGTAGTHGRWGHAFVVGRRSWLESLWLRTANVDAFRVQDGAAGGTLDLGRWSLDASGLWTTDRLSDSGRTGVTTSDNPRPFSNARSTLAAHVGVRGRWSERWSFRGRAWTARARGDGLRIPLGRLEVNTRVAMDEVGVATRLSFETRILTVGVGLASIAASARTRLEYTHPLPTVETPPIVSLGTIDLDHRDHRWRGSAWAESAPGALPIRVSAGIAAITAATGTVMDGNAGLTVDVTGGAFRVGIAQRHTWDFHGEDPRAEPWDAYSAVDYFTLLGNADGDSTTRRAARSRRLTIGLSRTITMGTIRADVYLARVADLPDLSVPEDGLGLPMLTRVAARVMGAEVTAQVQPWPWVAIRIGYAFNRARTGPTNRPTDFEVPHRIRALVQLGAHRGWFANADATVESGRPYTPVAFAYARQEFDPMVGVRNPLVPGALALLTGEENAARYPLNHRLDLSVGYRGSTVGRTEWELFLAAVNLTGGLRIPQRTVRLPAAPGSPTVRTGSRDQYSVPPIPVVGLRVRF